MQIGQERWHCDIVPTLSADERNKTHQATGKAAGDLDMTNPCDNVVVGACYIKKAIDSQGGVECCLNFYVASSKA